MNTGEVLSSAIHTYGKTGQIRLCIEEMAELTKALCKLYRQSDHEQYQACLENIREEIADVKIMLAQMEMIFGSVEDILCRKMELIREGLQKAGNKTQGNTDGK